MNDQDQRLDRGVLAVALVVVLGAVMSILDITVVNVAIRTLAQDFSTDLATIQWVVTGYTLALAAVIPLTGWAADRFGTKRLYVVSIGLFVAGSALASAAWSAESLIAFRVLQGLGGGMILPAGMTILTRAAGADRIGRVMAIIGVPILLGPVLGPILGGWLVESASWRWIFLINVPIGAVALLLSVRVLPVDEPQPGHRLDWLGLGLLSPGLALLIYGLAESGSSGGFGSGKVLLATLTGATLLIGFAVQSLRSEDPLIDLGLFANRTFSIASGTMILMAVSVFGGMLLVPLYLQAVRGESAFDTGLLLAPQGLGAMLVVPLAGRLSDRTGVGRIVPFGLVLAAFSFFSLTALTTDTPYSVLCAILFLQGMGMGAALMPLFSGAMQTLRRSTVARASTVLNIIQQVGASIGTAVMAVLLTQAIASRLPAGAVGAGFDAEIPEGARERVAPILADSFAETFWWAFALVVVALVASFFLPKHRPEPVHDPDDDAPAAPALIPH
ncbi:MAG TPA: DHA2 family efflux MFS transporter permease subunit [Solirubrobacteraceae bacterium]|nr:DHA2 family efflux MFS transporter permease subunit [Solirubrobacteraceae bacterium]